MNEQKITLTIRNIGHNGEGIGSLEGCTVFVDGALPGETIEAEIAEQHKRYARATLLKIVSPSNDRINPICSLFGTCGGCQLMHLSYEQQLKVKQQRVIDAMLRIGKLEDISVLPCIPSPSPLTYRNKIQLPVRQNREGISIGLYARASHDLVDVPTCYIHCPLGEQVYQNIKAIIKNSTIKAYDPVTGQGELRHILIKSAIRTGKALVILVTNQKPSPLLQRMAQELMLRCPSVKGVVHNKNGSSNNVVLGKSYETLEGVGFIHERINGLIFKVSPASFFQVNPEQAERIYAKALELADLTGQETVLDAYCGVGTLALHFAKKARKVIGIECIPEAIEDAKENAKLNGIENATFICAQAENHTELLSEIDVALLNPPRKGCEPQFLHALEKLSPKTIVYISCDPATLARDLSILKNFGYGMDCIQPYDMFPQTAHVECVVKLKKIYAKIS